MLRTRAVRGMLAVIRAENRSAAIWSVPWAELAPPSIDLHHASHSFR